MTRFYLLFSLLVSQAFLTCFAQQLKFEQLDLNHGLPSTEVYNLYKDKQGYIWAFTEFGVVKHNGHSFIPVCTNLRLNEAGIYAITESPLGDLYIGSSKGKIYKVINDSAIQVEGFEKNTADLLKNNEIFYDLKIDEDENIWYTTFYKSFMFSQKTGKTIELSKKPEYSKGIHFKELTNSYFLIKSEICSREEGFIRVQNLKGNIEADVKTPLLIMERNSMIKKGNRYYFLLSEKVILLDERKQLHTYKLPDASISFKAAPSGNIWVATNSGLIELDPGLNFLSKYLTEVIIADILFDDQDGLWISSIGQGVFHCKSVSIRYFNNIPELRGNISLLKSFGKFLIIGTSDGGLYKYEKGQVEAIRSIKNNYHVTDAIQTGNGYLIGTKRIFYALDSNFLPISYNSDTRASCYGFAKGLNDTILVLSGSAVMKYHNKNLAYLIATPRKTKSMISDEEGNIYLGASEGLFLLNEKKFIKSENFNLLKNKNINKLVRDQFKNIWVCTKWDGLYKLTPDNSLVNIPGLPTNGIIYIHFVHDSIVVLLTNKGVFFNKLNSISDLPEWRMLLGSEAISTSLLDGKLFIATKQGLTSIPVKDIERFFSSRFYLTSLFCKGKKISPENISLQHNENELLFNFDVLDYHGHGTLLSYSLTGPYKNKGWITGNQLHLQNLEPGSYSITIMALNGFSPNGLKTIVIHFNINPAFWQTGIFHFEVILLTLLLIILILFIIYRKLKKRAERKSMILGMIVQSRLTALKSQMNPHFISNSITAVQELVLTDQIDNANQYLAKFSLLIRNVLNYSDRFAASLNTELQIIDLYIQLEQLRFNNKFTFEVDIDPLINKNGTYIPPLITQPFVENAIWHGLLPLKGKRIPKLSLIMNMSASGLNISIIDNGVGRQKKVSPELAENSKKSRATDLTMKRIESLNVMYSTNEISITFTDLFDEVQQPAGLRVEIHFPTHVLDALKNEKDKHDIDR
ncbi:MAG: histidine kinase [Bacteroidota bacterium]|nr:histidine kinase [Bacteroidota bacterium]